MTDGSLRVSVEISNFLVTAENTMGPGSPSLATADTSIVLTNLVQL